ncbi:hypothetical protein ACHAXA_008404 [Cyclostephanos tholiformis]|uniref:Uncharacterized protein n=1 Tax=Cyclostephanos tholiformis TaxID=382380 RepID=A0ABD3RK54_9STRA
MRLPSPPSPRRATVDVIPSSSSRPPSWQPVVASGIRMIGGEEGAADDSTATTIEDSAPPTGVEDERRPEEDEKEEERKTKEVEELKLSIASLESSLKAKRSQLSNLKDQADKYSSAGYARQVASVEHAKRVHGANVADDKTAARASMLRSFLPTFDELDVLGGRYNRNAFARTFDSGLRSPPLVAPLSLVGCCIPGAPAYCTDGCCVSCHHAAAFCGPTPLTSHL